VNAVYFRARVGIWHDALARTRVMAPHNATSGTECKRNEATRVTSAVDTPLVKSATEWPKSVASGATEPNFTSASSRRILVPEPTILIVYLIARKNKISRELMYVRIDENIAAHLEWITLFPPRYARY